MDNSNSIEITIPKYRSSLQWLAPCKVYNVYYEHEELVFEEIQERVDNPEI